MSKKTRVLCCVLAVITLLSSIMVFSTTSASAATNLSRPTLTILNGGSTQDALRVKWTAVPGATGYMLAWRQRGSGHAYNTRYISNATSYSITYDEHNTNFALKHGALYEVQVRPTNDNIAQNFGPWSYNKTMTYLKKEGYVSLLNRKDNIVTVEYGRYQFVNQYQIAYKIGNGSYNYLTVSDDPMMRYVEPNKTSYFKVYGKDKVYVQVRCCYKTDKNGTAYGPWSSTKTI